MTIDLVPRYKNHKLVKTKSPEVHALSRCQQTETDYRYVKNTEMRCFRFGNIMVLVNLSTGIAAIIVKYFTRTTLVCEPSFFAPVALH